MHLVLDVPTAHPFKTPRRKMNSRAPPIGRWTRMVPPGVLAELFHAGNLENTIVIDSRSFLEYNTSHIANSVNVGCSKIVKRRLEQNKLTVQELLSTSGQEEKYSPSCDVIVYDQSTQDVSRLCPDSFLVVLLSKLTETFKTVSMLSGGFTAFKTAFPYLCEPQGTAQCTMLGPTLSQPCLPVAKVGPTRVLNYLYIGSQQDVLDEDIMRAHGINYVLNVSKTCPSPTHIAPGHFHRIPVRDNYGEKLLPWFEDAMDFIEKVRSANGCVIVHCLAGISRSPTVAIAYIMKHMNLSVDEAYKYVKEKRQSISPNFNFLGQLLEFEKRLHRDHPPKEMPAEPAVTATTTASATTATSTHSTSVSSDSTPASCKGQSVADVKESSSSSQPNPAVRVTKPGAPFPEPILLTEDTQAVAAEPSTPSSAEPRTHKRSISEQKEGELSSPPPDRSPKFRIRTIPRPRGLDVKVSKIGPIFLGSPPSSESKKPRSGHSSPCGLLEQLAWGTSHLSVNSPEVRQKNPFVEACARLAEKRLQEDAESRIRDEAKTVQQSDTTNAEVTSTVNDSPPVPLEIPSAPKPQEPMVILETKTPEPQTAKTELQLQVGSTTESSSVNNPNVTGYATTLTHLKKDDQRKPVEVKRRGILKTEGKGRAKVRSKSPRNVGSHPLQMAVKQTLTGKSQVTIKSTNKESPQPKVKKGASPTETSVSFQFGRTRVGKFMDAVLPNAGNKCKASKAKNKDYPQLMVAKEVHVQLETPRHTSIGNKSPSPKDPLNPFFSRQISSHSQSSDNSSGISPSCDSESGSIGLNSPSSSGICPDYPGQSPNLFDSLGNLVRAPLLSEVKSCPNFSTVSETAVGSQMPVQRSNTVTTTSEECKTNVWQKRKECGNSFEESAVRPEPSPLDRLSGYAAKRGHVISDHTDCDRSDTRCNSRKMPMVVAGRSASCEEISSCAREAVSEIVVRPRRDIIDMTSYGTGMDGEEDDYDSRSLSSQRSLSSSCEMIEVS